MISRLTAFAACFAVLSAATITFAANEAQREMPTQAAATKAALPVYRLPLVEITGHRSR